MTDLLYFSLSLQPALILPPESRCFRKGLLKQDLPQKPSVGTGPLLVIFPTPHIYYCCWWAEKVRGGWHLFTCWCSLWGPRDLASFPGSLFPITSPPFSVCSHITPAGRLSSVPRWSIYSLFFIHLFNKYLLNLCYAIRWTQLVREIILQPWAHLLLINRELSSPCLNMTINILATMCLWRTEMKWDWNWNV